MERSKSWSSSQASSAWASAAGQSPRSRSTSARWMRQAPGKPLTSSLSQKRLAVSVHSDARRKSPRSLQELIVMQYTSPAECARRSPHDRRRRRLVEEREPFVDPPALDEAIALSRRERASARPGRRHASRAPTRRRTARTALSRSPSANSRLQSVDEEHPAVLGRLRAAPQGGAPRSRASRLRRRTTRARRGPTRASTPCAPRRARRSRPCTRVRALAQRDRLVGLSAPPRGFAVVLEV